MPGPRPRRLPALVFSLFIGLWESPSRPQFIRLPPLRALSAAVRALVLTTSPVSRWMEPEGLFNPEQRRCSLEHALPAAPPPAPAPLRLSKKLFKDSLEATRGTLLPTLETDLSAVLSFLCCSPLKPVLKVPRVLPCEPLPGASYEGNPALSLVCDHGLHFGVFVDLVTCCYIPPSFFVCVALGEEKEGALYRIPFPSCV